jgi:hypothetical protein
MKKDLNENLEDILIEMKISLLSVYQRGYEQGEKNQGLINEKLSNPKLILADFIKFIKNYKMTMIDGDIKFSNNDYVYMDENIINLFLLKYDYDAE